MKLLFVCSRNKRRSPTAAQVVFAAWDDIETDSAGLATDAVTPLSSEQLEWADIVFVMERAQERKLQREFHRWLANKRVVCLDIADDYDFMQPELVVLLDRKVGPLLRRHS